MRTLRWSWLFGLVGLLCGCGGDPEVCLPALPEDCNLLFEPSYDVLYKQFFSKTCNEAGCHDTKTAQAGLSFADHDEAYKLLLGDGPDGRARVLPGNPECSLLMRRLESSDPQFRMPPGGGALPGARCAVQQWIAKGALPPKKGL